MSKYVWINPVAQKMYGEKLSKIERYLQDKSYILAECEQQMDYVRNEYEEHFKKTENPILDCRCPESISLLRRENLLKGFNIPDIEPILVRTSRVLYDKYIKNNDDTLIITCPCTQLRDFAKSRMEGCRNIEFYTWKEFIESEGMNSLGKIDESPIPLGFFRNSFENILEISGENEILNEIKDVYNEKNRRYDIIEMLYCKDGCNNGDGL